MKCNESVYWEVQFLNLLTGMMEGFWLLGSNRLGHFASPVCSPALPFAVAIIYVLLHIKWLRVTNSSCVLMTSRFYHDVPPAIHKLQTEIGCSSSMETDDLQIFEHNHRRSLCICHQNANATPPFSFP